MTAPSTKIASYSCSLSIDSNADVCRFSYVIMYPFRLDNIAFFGYIQWVKKTNRILLATGIFYPDVGGPAIHVRKIAERLTVEGFQVTVLAYGDDPGGTTFPFTVERISRRYPKPTQWFLYFLHVLSRTFQSGLVYAFDPTAAGIPASIAARILHKPFIIRIGGDPIWEREAEEGRIFMTLDQYYQNGLYKKDKPRLYRAIKRMLRRAKALVVYNQNFKDFYSKYYGVPKEKIRIVKNPVFKREDASETLSDDPKILFAGRFVNYKNLPLVMKAFDAVREKTGKGKLMLIGKGPDKDKLLQLKNTLHHGDHIIFKNSVSQEDLFNFIKDSALCIG